MKQNTGSAKIIFIRQALCNKSINEQYYDIIWCTVMLDIVHAHAEIMGLLEKERKREREREGERGCVREGGETVY